jgi:hypothetical protein
MVIQTEGDIGDVCILLSIIKQIPGGPHTLLVQSSGCTKAKSPREADRLCRLVKPLAESQDYISECRRVNAGEHIDWNSAGFRGQGYNPGNTLFGAHLSHLITTKGIGHGFKADKAWLKVDPAPDSKGRVIVNRTGRYRNHFFPWREIYAKYKDRILFIGLPHEYRDFSGQFGACEYRYTENMLDVAEVIAGSLLFIGNQSSPNAVAEGLKHDMIQEVSLQVPDCIYHRSNAQHIFDERCRLPGFDGEPDTFVDEREIVGIDTMTVPPGYWQYPGCPVSLSHMQMIKLMKRLPEFAGAETKDVERALMKHTLARCPSIGRRMGNFSKVKTALKCAGAT